MKNYNTLQDKVADLFPGEISDHDIMEFLASNEAHKDLDDSDSFAVSISETTSEELRAQNYNAEYRGWYGTQSRPRWCPKQSKFNGRGGNHKGADIFAQKGTQLVALIDGAIQWNPRGSGGKWGNHVFLNFRNGGNNYTFVYAHLDALIGSNNRRVRSGEVICTSGCSGNTVYCGSKNKCGGLEDHVHLELFGPDGRIDPIAALRWKMRHASDTRCFYPSC